MGKVSLSFSLASCMTSAEEKIEKGTKQLWFCITDWEKISKQVSIFGSVFFKKVEFHSYFLFECLLH